MAGRKCMKGGKYLAKLAEKNAPCAFCKRNVDEETLYGKLYSIGDIHCHYFCVLLSCCLIQKGNDEEGLFGFMYPDILAEVERSKKHRCSFCGMEGATLGCSVAQCKKQFHLPCGREKKAVSLYFGNYKSFCEKHAPKQKIPSVIMSKARSRLNAISKGNREKSMRNLKTSKNKDKSKKSECTEESECVCVICYESVDGFPTTETFWPPCCARDAWFHRSCLQRMALSAGMHYLKCPLCNDKQTFSSAILEQGYFIPDRDAAWELEQNAFSEIYERPAVCLANVCHCAKGREFDADSGSWDIKLCVLCGGPGSHAECLTAEFYVCAVCGPAAPDTTHLAAISAVSLPSHDQSPQRPPSGPVMPSRMSLRRTKQKHTLYTPSCSSQNLHIKTEAEINAVKSNTDLSREDLNLKTPKRPPTTAPTEHKQLETTESSSSPLKQPEHELSSPLKLLKQGLHDRIPSTEVERVILDRNILEEMREKFKVPKPACVKKRIVGEILQGLLDYITNEENKMECMNSTEKFKEPIKEATTDENKENILELTIKNSGEIQTEDLSSMHDVSMTPENVPDISEKDISEPLEENILQSSIVEQLIICGNTNFTPKKGEISCSLKKEDLSLKYYTSKLPEHISECSEQNSSSSGVQFRKHQVSEPLEENILQLSTLEKLIICENASLTPKKKEILEENSRSSSNSSPFQLPPEFIAESSNSTPIIETPKKLKKINIENDSMEISENNQIVNIDLVKGENKPSKDYKVPDKCAFKLSPLNKNILEKNLDIDLESFKNHYLNEVDKKFICKFEPNLSESEKSPAKLSTDIDFALDGLKKPPKRKLPTSDNVANKRRKTTEMVRKSKKQPNDRNNDKNRNKTHNDEKSDQKRRYKKRSDHDKIKDKFDSTECNGEKKKYKKRKYKNNHNTELSIRNRNINLKIRFKSEELDLKISKPKKRGRSIKKENPKILKQYVLKYPTEKTSTKDCIARPDTDVTPMKRKYNIKSEKSCDNLKQTSIANFFKISLKTEIE